ncbi:hypothetical protein MANES_13G089634v8 [Manihot esculenta]|uniref:Uncharacterized protein n=1 Tax=Manihot esculenta TaxID=3983 RepID=A0ACB7GLC1_MANES|nr:hypothetical protein MANES_13G089634v8 [Manihot esculenta]
MHIGSRNKAGYLTGEVKKPPPEDPSYAIWVTENYKVKSWLIDSMDPLLMQRSLSTYYNKLVVIFQEIDHMMTSQEETVEGVVQLHSTMARLRVHIFLSELDLEFDHVCGEILRKDPKLNLESTYAYVRREYQQRQTMGGSRPISESSVMVAKRTQQGPSSGSIKTQSAKPNNFVYSYCSETGHSKQRCYEIIGYPEWWDFIKKPRKKVVGTPMMAATTKVQQNMEDKSQSIANVLSATSKNSTWIIDTGAFDHMTKDSGQLQSIRASSQSVIPTANVTHPG